MEGQDAEVEDTRILDNRQVSGESEVETSTDLLSEDVGETDGEAVQQVTITLRVVKALSNMLDKIPRTVLLQGNQSAIENIILTVVENSLVPSGRSDQNVGQGESAEPPSGDTRPNSSSEKQPALRG